MSMMTKKYMKMGIRKCSRVEVFALNGIVDEIRWLKDKNEHLRH